MLFHCVMRWLFGAVLACLGGVGALLAASFSTPGDQDLIRERQDRLLDEQLRRLETLKELPGKEAAPATLDSSADARCFPVSHIVINGAAQLSESAREQLVQPYQEQCLGTTQLNELLKDITHHYVNRGLVTSRAYLPQQDLSGGNLHILVIEGTLEGVTAAQDSSLSRRELAMSFPGQPGDLFNLRDIEQALDQLNRLPSNHAQVELAPGNSVGGSTVSVKNTPQMPWRASLSRHNDGRKGTGEQQWGTGLEWDSPLGLADQLILRGSRDALSDQRKTSKSAMLYYNLPWGWWNFSYAYSQSEYRSVVQGNGFDFDQSGDSENHQLRAERVVHRDGLSKTSVNVGLTHLRTNNYLEDAWLETSSHRLSEWQFGLNHGRRVGGAFVNFDMGMQNGSGALDAQDNGHPRPGLPDARYRKYTATLSYLQPFRLWDESFSFVSLATGQRSEDVLFGPQRLSLGGSSSVRGYKHQSLIGDSGGYWRNSLRWARPVNASWLRPVFAEYGISIGHDQGVIRNDRYNGDHHGRVSGNALELFARGRNLSASVTFAHSLERPDVITEREAPIWFRLDFSL